MEKYNCRIAATACNGKVGLEVIRREKPDILFFRYLHAGTGRAVHDRGTESRISGYGDQHSDRFQGIAHFSRVFKKNEGISANEYRNTKIT